MIRHTILIVGAVLLANMLTWLAFGRQNALLRGADATLVLNSVSAPDSLILFTGHLDGLEDEYAQYADFSAASIRALQDQLQKRTHLDVVVDPRPVPIGSGDGDEMLMNKALAYHVAVDRRLPMYAVVVRSVYAPGFIATFESKNLWFFRWWEIGDQMTGIS